LTILEGRIPNSIFAKIYYDDLVVIYCGKFVKFGKIVPNKKKKKGQGNDVMDLNLHIYKNKSIF
jgi:hypothetical protein